MKKLLLLATLPLWVACSKSENMTTAPSTSAAAGVKAKKSVNTTFSSSGIEQGDEIYHGTFSVSGFINGAGTSGDSFSVNIPTGGNRSALMYATYTFTSTQTFTFNGGAGSITVVTNGQWWFTDATLLHAAGSGNCNVISSTGTYAGLHG